MTKISQLSSIGDSLAVDDQFLIRDVSDISTPNKSVTVSGITRALPLGTAAAPAIAFASDKNTGIYSPGADQVAISTNGTGRLFVDASGNVSVGTSNTGYGRLGVYEASNGLFSVANSTSYGQFQQNGSDLYVNYNLAGAAGGNFIFRSGAGSAETLRITSAGLVGIGTSSPQALLNVHSQTSTGDLTVINLGTLSGSAGSQAIYLGAYNSTLYGCKIKAIYNYGAAASASIAFETANAAGTLTEVLRIDSSQRVGIGTTAPQHKLQVSGGSLCVDGFSDSANAYISFREGFSPSAAGGTGFRAIDHSGANADGLGCYGADGISFYTFATERARIDSSGRLLVGTSTARTLFFGGASALTQIEGNSTATASLSITRNDVTADGNALVLAKARSTSYAIVVNDDRIGRISFQGADGTTMVPAASIESFVDGTPGANDMPGRLVFSTTADGASSPTERLRITSAGNVGIGTTSPAATLDVVGTTNITSTGATLTLDRTGGGEALIYLKKAGATGGLIGTTGNSDITFYNGAGSERARIDSSGRLLVGTSSSSSVGGAAAISQIVTGANIGLSILRHGDVPILALGATGGSPATVVSSGQNLGEIRFAGADGTDVNTTGASIVAVVDGTPGADDMPGRLVFSTTADGAASPTERMRITSGGNILTNTTSTYSVSLCTTDFNSESQFGLTLRDTGSAIDANMMYFYKSGNVRGNITTTATATSFNTSSDYRLKQDIVPIENASSRVQQLRPVNFAWIETGSRCDGFLAHEAQAVVPQSVTGEKDAVDDDGNPIYQGIDQSKLVPLLTAALQEAIAEIKALKDRVTALEGA